MRAGLTQAPTRFIAAAQVHEQQINRLSLEKGFGILIRKRCRYL